MLNTSKTLSAQQSTFPVPQQTFTRPCMQPYQLVRALPEPHPAVARHACGRAGASPKLSRGWKPPAQALRPPQGFERGRTHPPCVRTRPVNRPAAVGLSLTDGEYTTRPRTGAGAGAGAAARARTETDIGTILPSRPPATTAAAHQRAPLCRHALSSRTLALTAAAAVLFATPR
jgi:hypothetical protein